MVDDEKIGQRTLLRAEATAAFTSKHILTEALTARTAKMIAEGKSPKRITQMMDLIDRASKPDEISEAVLKSLQ